MRFAYIDSQGNEMEIPSEDALRLRIELGAIVAGTSFFDGESGRWAPAAEHEVFRRLTRELAEKGHPGADRGEAAPSPAPRQPPVVADTPPDHGDDGDEGTFDFGDFGALDLEETAVVPARPTSPSPETPSVRYQVAESEPVDDPEADPWTVPGRDPWPPNPDLSVPSLERPVEMGSVGFGDEPPPPADEQAPTQHPFDADDDMPDWLRGDPEFGDGAKPDSSPVTFPTRDEVKGRHGAESGSGRTAATRTAARTANRRGRRAPTSRKRVFGGVAVVVVAVAGGVWWLAQGGAGEASANTEVVPLPALVPSLEPVLRRVVVLAADETIDTLRELSPRAALAAEPDVDWLGGRYMANAGQFSDVRLYWESVARYLQVMRAREAEVFAGRLAAALDTITLPDDDRAMVEDRALAGFEAAAPQRDAVYAQLRAVVDAALSLHVFLEQNEDAIDYEPAAAGLSRDPVLEAVPITETLGDEMWNRVAAITSALDQLGFLDRVTTERLLGVFFDKLEAVKVR